MRNKLFLLAFITSATLYAEEIQLDKSIINSSATYTGSVIGSESKNVVLVTKDDIQKKQYKNVVDIFKDSPVTMVTHTKGGDLVALRGSGEKTVMRVNVLLNGNPINTIDEQMGVIPFNAIPVDSIEKVEIIPGGGITLYGSGSSSGVINIITNKTNKNPYGSLSYTNSSFGTNNVQVTKGVKLTDNLFADIAVEGEKGDGYRDKERHKKLNALGGVEYKINDKNKIRFSGMKYKSDDDSTNEVSLFDLERNRTKAGDTLSNVKGDRDSFGIDYEYKPTKNLNMNFSLNKSKFTRDVDADGRPLFTFLPTIDFFEDFFRWSSLKCDLALNDIPWKMKGQFKEDIESGKFKTDYTYNDGRGKITVGYDYKDHKLMRKFDQNTAPFNELLDASFVIHRENERLFSEESIKQPNFVRIKLMDFILADYYYDPTNYAKTESGKEYTEDELYNSKAFNKIYDEIYKNVLYSDATPEMIKKYEKELASGVPKEVAIKRITDAITASNESYSDHDIRLKVLGGKLENMPKMKILDFINPNALVTKDGKKGLYMRTNFEYDKYGELPDPIYKFFEIDENTTFADYSKHLFKGPETTTRSFVSAKVDVDKKTNSFYLHNKYNLTDRFSMTAGLRYEQAKYKGSRETESKQIVTVDPNLSSNDRIQAVENFAPTLERYLKGSDKLHITKQNFQSSDDFQERYGKYRDELLEELKEKGQIIIPMSNLSSEYTKTENNIGGEVGFSYKFNDSNQVYTRYERAFNTPLPTQMTNKTFDPIHKVRVYWDSNIKTETMNNFEIGFRGMINDNINISAAAFLSNTNNEIVTLVKDGNSPMTREWRFMNLDKTRRMGIELQSEQFFDKFNLKESITFISPKIVSNDYENQVKEVIDSQRDLLIEAHRRDKTYLKTEYLDKIKTGNDIQKKIEEYYANHNYKEEYYSAFSPKDKEKNLQTISEYVNNVIEPMLESLDQTQKEEYSRAIEFELQDDLRYAYETNLLYNSTYALKHGEYLEKGDEIPLAPKVKATLSADYQFTDKLKLGANFNYIGSFTSVEPGRHYGVIKTKVPAHWVTDIYGTYDVTPDFSIKFGVNNVFNHDYNLRQDSYTATPAAKRTYTAGFSYQF